MNIAQFILSKSISFTIKLALVSVGKKPFDRSKFYKKLTIDTADALKYTSIALSEYAIEMLKGNEYVLLGQVTNDPIEKQFGKYRQSGGSGTYLVTVRISSRDSV